MKIADLRRLNGPPSAKGFRALARFSLVVADGFRLYDYELVQAPSGQLEVYPPPCRGGRTAAMSPAVRRQIADLAENILKEHHDQQHSVQGA
ncbi:hypothetical protein GGE60_005899 [Rhizobium leucaenae]|uniref:Uncharacterized protein n=1 Tax=Rhizobium leucaenae TaxID=29450 RepID=A0A7W6ZZM0_9HYPH|nr:hypothetical protein [Rhizobium leucaenae]